MENKRKTCVYFHRNAQTNEIFYVGIGTLKRSRSKDLRNPFWYHYVAKYGFKVEIYCTELTRKEAACWEVRLIHYIGRRDLKEGTLVNLTAGGEGVCELSAESRAKMSLAKKGKPMSEERKAKHKLYCKGNNAGKKLTDEHKEKLAAAKRGRTLSPEHRAKIGAAGIGRPQTPERIEKMLATRRLNKLKKESQTI